MTVLYTALTLPYAHICVHHAHLFVHVETNQAPHQHFLTQFRSSLQTSLDFC